MKKPKKLTICVENIPEELKKIKQWTCWKYEWNGKKWTKPPCDINGKTKDHLQSNLSFKNVLGAAQKNKEIAGIGISMRDDDSICGIDIDHCVTKNIIDKNAKKIIKKVKSYTEISPSGEGVRIFGFGEPLLLGASPKKRNIEVYHKGRYLTVTGQKVDDYQLKDITKATNKITKKYRGKKNKNKKQISSGGGVISPALISKLVHIPPSMSYPDWYNICLGIHDLFDGSEEGANLFVRWSRGDFWVEPVENFVDEEDCFEKYHQVPGNKEEKRTGKTIDFYHSKYKPSISIHNVKTKKNKTANIIRFPDNPYDGKGIPKIAQRLFQEFHAASPQPINCFLYMAVEATLQYLVGRMALTPMFGRTTSTPMLGAGLSTSGKDLNTSIILSQFKRELTKYAKKSGDAGYVQSLLQLGSKTGSHTSATSFISMLSKEKLDFWLDTEASGILKIIAHADKNPHGGGALVIALNELFDGHEITGRNFAEGKNNIQPIELPHVPIVWLTQIDTFAQIITPELLDVGFLGRLDYFFDLEKRDPISPFSKGFSGYKFTKKIMNMVFKFLSWSADLQPKETIMNDAAREIIFNWEMKNIYNGEKNANYEKFLRRISMSAEKRLACYALLNGDYQITTDMVESHLPIMDYQLSTREHIYHNEIMGQDLMKDMSRVIDGILERINIKKKGEAKLKKAGWVRWGKFSQNFRNNYRNKYPELMKASNMQREIEANIKMGNIEVSDVDGFGGKFIRRLV